MRTTIPFVCHSSLLRRGFVSGGILLLCGWLNITLQAATLSWSGGSASSGNWSDSANWGYAGIPANGDTLIFSAGQPRLANTNNISSLTLNQIRFLGAGGGYTIRGNPFTLTNNILANNTAGANTIENSIGLATVDQAVDVTVALTLSGQLSGSVGLTKTGVGTLTYQYAGNNTYAGTTRVNAGTLQLNVSGASAFGGPLVIGDGAGTGSPIVRLLQSSEISDGTAVAINLGGQLDLNGWSEAIGSLTLQGGAASSGSGTLFLNGNLAVLTSASSAIISGKLALNGSGLHTVSVADGGSLYDLDLQANVTDSGGGILFTNSVAGSSWARLTGSNFITGPVTLNNLTVDAENSNALGITNDVTVGGAGNLWLYSSGFTNLHLTLDSGATLTAQNTCVWTGAIYLGGHATIHLFTAGSNLSLTGGIAGGGGFTKTGSGTLTIGGNFSNNYMGQTYVDDGVLNLSKANGARATGSGMLTIGDGTGTAGSAMVREYGNAEISMASVTINSDGLLDLNGYNDSIGPSLIFNDGGDLQTGAGLLSLTSGATVTCNPAAHAGDSVLSGKLDISSGTCNFIIGSVKYGGVLDVTAVVSGSATLRKTGRGTLYLEGANTFTGLVSVEDGIVEVDNALSLGSSAVGTVVSNTANLYLSGNAHIAAEPLKLASSDATGALYNRSGTNVWGGPVTLANATTIYVPTNSALAISNAITGAGDFTQRGAGLLSFLGTNRNTFGGTTYVTGNSTLLLSNTCVTAYSAIPGPLVISSNCTVLCAANWQLGHPVTLYDFGLLNLLGSTYDYVEALTLQAARVKTGNSGLIYLAGDILINSSTNLNSTIAGRASLWNGTRTITTTAWALDTDLEIYATLSGSSGSGLIKNGAGSVGLSGTNSFSGPIVINEGDFELNDALAVGNTNTSLTVNTNGRLILRTPMHIGAKPVIMNGGEIGVMNDQIWDGNVTLASDSTISVWNSTDSLTLNGIISGSGRLTKTEEGTLWFSGPGDNPYTGATYVNGGTLKLNVGGTQAFSGPLVIGDDVYYDFPTVSLARNNQIPEGPTITITLGKLDLNNFSDTIGRKLELSQAQIVTGSGMLTLSPNATVTASYWRPAICQISGNLNINSGTCTFDVDDVENELRIDASVSGAAGIYKSGNGFLRLISSNSFSGLTVVSHGWLCLSNSCALGATSNGTEVWGGATLAMNGTFGVTNESLTLNGSGVDGYEGALRVEDSTNIWAGPITNQTTCTVNTINPNAVMRLSGPASGPGGVHFTGNGTHYIEGSAANTYAGTTTVDPNCTLVLGKSVDNGAIPGDLSIYGTVRYGPGNFQIHDHARVTVQSSGLLDLNLHNDAFDALVGNGQVIISGVALIVNMNHSTSTFDGVISGVGALYKYGDGTLTLNGNNTLTGNTVVQTGTLVVNGSQPQSPVVVGGGTTLGGRGTVGSITGNGAVAPGTSPGLLTTSNLVFSSSGSFNVELTGPNAGTDYDQLNVRGTNALGNAGINLNLAFHSPVSLGQKFTLINNDGTDPISGIFIGYPEGSTWLQNGYATSISYVGGTGNDVVLTLTSIPAAGTGAEVTAGSGSHGIDPNSCNNLNLIITNTSGMAMTGVKATLCTTNQNVIITQPYSPYSNIAANGKGTNLAPFQISTLPTFVCGTPIRLQLIVESSLGSFIMNYVLYSGEVAAVPSRYDVTGDVAINDFTTIESTNTVGGFMAVPLKKVAVSLYLTHTFDGDLTNISLVAPDGTTVLLSSANGGSGDNYGSALTPDSSRTTFDDAAATPITGGVAPFVGSYRPQSPLSALNGLMMTNGNWKLRISDGASGDAGTLRGWSLFLYGTTCATGSGICDLCLPATTNSITTSDLVQSGRSILDLKAASCGSPKAWAGTAAGSYHYDVHTFTNTSADDACVTAILQSPSNLLATAYLTLFDPANVTNNYLGDAGRGTLGGTTMFSFSVTPGAIFKVVVTEVFTNAVTQPYTLQLSGLPCPPPTLNIQPVATDQARLHWSTASGGYLLEAVPSLGSANWTGVTNEPMVSAGRFNVTNTINPTNQFYRLHKP